MRSERVVSQSQSQPAANDQKAGPPARGTRLRPSARLTAGSVVPVLLAVLAAAFAYEALQDRSSMTSIVVASSVLPVGAPVDSQDTHAVRVHSSDTALALGFLTPAQLDDGWVAAIEVRAGEPVTMSEIEKSSAVPALGQMSIAVPLQQAAGGRIGAGDLVDVIASNGSGGAYYVAQSLRVVGVAPTSASTGVLAGGTGSYFVVVAVGKLTALRIAAALGAQGGGASGNSVEIVRSSGEAPAAQVRYGMSAPQITQSTSSSGTSPGSSQAGTGGKAS